MYRLVRSGKSGVVLTSMTDGDESRDSTIEEWALLLSKWRWTELYYVSVQLSYPGIHAGQGIG
ncbi:MAG: hypothetical protein HFE97_03310 [Oscillospiraceae bacterium]|nr:hypothetical protein [Oscillospiraceae bacterium]